MSEIVIFENAEFGKIRTIDKDGNPWFVATDAANILGYRDAHDMVRNLDDDEKGTHIVRTPGGEQSVTVINESGLYSAILRSRKPEAKAFKKWVTSEVLPAIRKNGVYSIKNPLSRKEEFELGVSALEASSRLLRMSDISKLSCLKHLCISMGVSTEGLPKYLPRKNHILSATELLKRRSKPMSIHTFNGMMLALGLLEIRERPSTNGQEVRKFKALTEAGMYYGENSVNPDYPLETQPHYYENKFDSLLEYLKENTDTLNN